MKDSQNRYTAIQMHRRAVRNRREHGMALLFTLCILSMALITAMIFSSNATTDRKVASAYIDSSAARILADGTVSRAILALMASPNASYVCSNYNLSTSKPSNSDRDDYAVDWVWKLEKPGVFTFNEGPLRYDSLRYDLDDTRCPSWEYVFYNHPDDGRQRIYGRYAYVAIGQNDQLNPNALSKKKFLSDSDRAIQEKRLGRWTSEPEFIFKDKNGVWDYTGEISPEKIRNNPPTDGWSDMDIFLSDMSSSTDKHLRMMADQYFNLSFEKDYNKYNTQGNLVGDYTKTPGSGERYRFPLIQYPRYWENCTIDDIKREIPYFNVSSTVVDQTIANLLNYNSSFTRPPVTDKPNWATQEPSYTGNKRTPYINEVACEVEVGGNLGIRASQRYEDPNRKGVMLWRVWYTDCTYFHNIQLKIETVNMYGSSALAQNCEPIPFGTITYDYLNPETGGWIEQEFSFDANNFSKWDRTTIPPVTNGAYKTWTYVFDSGSVGSVTTHKEEGLPRPVGYEARFYPDLKIRNVRVRLDRVLLRDERNTNADLALMNGDLSAGYTVLSGEHGVAIAEADDTDRFGYMDTQVNDPRFNLGRDQWSSPNNTQMNMTAWYDGSNLGRSNTAINYNSNSPDEFDPGESGDPGNNISTAYIRHEPMESLWELGAIHRGAPWQTINLRCADGKSSGSTMGDYKNGDGNLLDQISLVPQDEEKEPVLGMINLNCVADLGGGGSPFVFKSIFTNFPIYSSYENMKSGSGSRLEGKAVNSTNSDADYYAQDLVDCVTNAVNRGSQPRRTSIFPTSGGNGSHSGKLFPTEGNDAQREEVVCRIINLLKWSRQQTRRATVLVLAQTVQDVGGDLTLEKNIASDTSAWMDAGLAPYGPADKIDSTRYKPKNFSTLTLLRNRYQSRRVAFKQYDNFYDRITGEAKVIVRLEWDDSANHGKGAWKVTRKEYAE